MKEHNPPKPKSPTVARGLQPEKVQGERDLQKVKRKAQAAEARDKVDPPPQ